MCRLLEVLQEPNESQTQPRSNNGERKMYSLVPIIFGDIMGDERMLFSGNGDRRDQGETILQPIGDSKNAHGPELDVAVMSRRGALEHIGRWV